MEALRSFGGTSLGPFPIVVWFGFATLVLLIVTAGIASLKKQIPALRRVSVRVHRGLAIAALALALFHLVLGLSVYL
jgi:DMSO/TMAO reductase YedYZ heme-binding membrane subunit